MRIDRDLLGWGVFFLVAGAIALAVQSGALEPRAWWSFWPLIIVGIGLGLVLRHTPVEALGGVVIAAAFGIMVGGSLAGGIGGLADLPGGVCGPDEGGTPFQARTGSLGATASVDLELDCGALHVSAAPGLGWVVEGTDDEGRGPIVESDQGELEVRPATGGPTLLVGDRDSWEVVLPAASRLDLSISLSAGRLEVDARDAQLDVLDVGVNAGSAVIDLTAVAAIDGIDIGLNAGSLALTLPSLPMTGSIEANAGSVTLCAPPDVALRLHTGDSVLASDDFGAAGLVRVDGGWETPGYDTAVTRIELRTEANAGTFRLDPAEGCR